jgi:ZIP family zinc transporter
VVNGARLWMTIGGIMLGYGLVALLNYLIDKNTNKEVAHSSSKDHPKTADDLDELIHSDHFNEHKKENDQLFTAGIIMAAAIALHNLPEGMVIGAAYAGDRGLNVWAGGGILIAMVIGLHNIPEGMAVAVPLIAGGMPRGRAILMTAISGFPTVIGAVIGFLLGSMGEVWHVLSLAFASGAMLYVVFGELLPESILMWKSKLPAMAIIVGILLGMGIIYA